MKFVEGLMVCCLFGETYDYTGTKAFARFFGSCMMVWHVCLW